MIIDSSMKQMNELKPERPGSLLKTVLNFLPEQIIRRRLYRMMQSVIISHFTLFYIIITLDVL